MNLKTTKADRLFSLYIRHRDNFTCQRCKVYIQPPTNEIHCSHFHSRRKKSVRFNPDNACALCSKCHMYFDGNTAWSIQPHKKEHEEFFIKRLGQDRFDLLTYVANRPMKVNEEYICIWIQDELKKMGIKENVKKTVS